MKVLHWTELQVGHMTVRLLTHSVAIWNIPGLLLQKNDNTYIFQLLHIKCGLCKSSVSFTKHELRHLSIKGPNIKLWQTNWCYDTVHASCLERSWGYLEWNLGQLLPLNEPGHLYILPWWLEYYFNSVWITYKFYIL
jgi:hypothetical protein